MKGYFLIGLFAFALLLGCLAPKAPEGTPTPAGTPQGSVQVATTSATPTATGPCAKPDVRFGNVLIPTKIYYGTSYELDVEVMYSQGSCPKPPTGAVLGLYDGKRKMLEMPVTLASEKNSVKVSLLAEQTRDYSLSLKLSLADAGESDEANNEYKFQFAALPFGFYEDVSGTSKFDISSLKMYAQSFKVVEPIAIKDIEIYLRKSTSDYESFDVVAQIRPDAGGKPSGANEINLAMGYAVLPSDYSWFKFSANRKTTLQKGTYWLVLRTFSVKPPVQVHMVPSGIFQNSISMKTSSDVPFQENWEEHKEGVMNFRFTNDEIPVLTDDTIVSPRAYPSWDVDPYGVV